MWTLTASGKAPYGAELATESNGTVDLSLRHGRNFTTHIDVEKQSPIHFVVASKETTREVKKGHSEFPKEQKARSMRTDYELNVEGPMTLSEAMNVDNVI